MAAPRPINETARQAALDRYLAIDNGSDEYFADIARLAAFICQSPIAAVTLIDGERQILRATFGVGKGEMSRADAFCAHTILQNDVMVVNDTGLDDRFRDNPLVTGAMNVRFYAGAPLVTPDNLNLGSLCVIDHKPRTLNAEQTSALAALSRLVMVVFELRRSSADLAKTLKEVRTLGELLPICSYCKDIRDDQGYWKRVEDYVGTRTGTDFSHGLCPKCARIHFPEVFANKP